MMENLKGIDSPMFDFIEQNAGKVKPKDLDDVQKERIYKSDVQVVEVLGILQSIICYRRGRKRGNYCLR